MEISHSLRGEELAEQFGQNDNKENEQIKILVVIVLPP
jgi:hypothetical protein